MYKEQNVDWIRAARCGISRRWLREIGVLDSLLAGEVSEVVTITLYAGNIPILVDARLSLIRENNGNIWFSINPIEDEDMIHSDVIDVSNLLNPQNEK